MKNDVWPGVVSSVLTSAIFFPLEQVETLMQVSPSCFSATGPLCHLCNSFKMSFLSKNTTPLTLVKATPMSNQHQVLVPSFFAPTVCHVCCLILGF